MTDSLRHSVDAYRRRLTTGSLSSIGADSVFAPAPNAIAEQPSSSAAAAGKAKKSSPDSVTDGVAASAAD